MMKNTVGYSSVPITVQISPQIAFSCNLRASLRVHKLALHSNRSNGYAFRSRAALMNTSPPASAAVILMRNAG
jgi:hypothetical protein